MSPLWRDVVEIARCIFVNHLNQFFRCLWSLGFVCQSVHQMKFHPTLHVLALIVINSSVLLFLKYFKQPASLWSWCTQDFSNYLVCINPATFIWLCFWVQCPKFNQQAMHKTKLLLYSFSFFNNLLHLDVRHSIGEMICQYFHSTLNSLCAAVGQLEWRMFEFRFPLRIFSLYILCVWELKWFHVGFRRNTFRRNKSSTLAFICVVLTRVSGIDLMRYKKETVMACQDLLMGL